MRIFKLDPGGTKREAVRDTNGCFVLGDPKFGNRKHADSNQVYVRDEEDAVYLIKGGFSIRVAGNKSPGLVRKNLYVDGIKVT